MVTFGGDAEWNEDTQSYLAGELAENPNPRVRAACAKALQKAAASDPMTADVLLERLDLDEADVVRAACASSLKDIAPIRSDIRERLKALVSSAPHVVRAGAIRGLSRIDLTASESRPLVERFLTAARSSAESPVVRAACLLAIDSLIGKEAIADQCIVASLDEFDKKVQRTALHLVAQAIADGRLAWTALVTKVEEMLMAVPDPSPSLCSALETIVAAKEIRGGHTLQRVVGDALSQFGDRIEIAFVFGSTARQEQVRDSDIDLMIIGEIRLKELATALHVAEQALGRTINPVLYSSDRFRDQYRAGNPFLTEVVRKEKAFLKGNRDELTAMVAE